MSTLCNISQLIFPNIFQQMNAILLQSSSTLRNICAFSVCISCQSSSKSCLTFIGICRNNLAILKWKRLVQVAFYGMLLICFTIDMQISCVI
uniref:Uncharacterized protein n=2 Tax=Populus trichocarpa TaxID=3694 RepID=A0A2K2BD69_POPTR